MIVCAVLMLDGKDIYRLCRVSTFMLGLVGERRNINEIVEYH